MNDLVASRNNAMNELFCVRPQEVKNFSNLAYLYYRDELYLKLQSRFKFNNIPSTWDIDYLRDNLFRVGYLCSVEYNNNNYLLYGGITGINVYNKPTEVQIANPILGTFKRDIGVNAELLYFNRINGMFRSADMIISRYATLLAQCDGSINTTLINSRVAHIFHADNEAEAKTFKKIYDDVTMGKPAVFTVKKKDLNIDKTNKVDFLNVKNTYIGNDLLDTKRTIMNEFLTEIGINNANTDKKERLISSEANANNAEIKTIVSLWLDTLNECCERINKLFNLNVSVELNESEVVTDEFNQYNSMVQTQSE